MKKLLFLLLIAPVLGFGQETLKIEGNTYTKVFQVNELNESEIYQKLNEFIALNFKSAKDVIQLDTPSKIICKGNFIVNYVSSASGNKSTIPIRCGANFTFSIREGRYKVDIETPTTLYNTLTKADYSNQIPPNGQNRYSTKEDFQNWYLEYVRKIYSDYGMSEKQINKTIEKVIIKEMDTFYSGYKENLEVWDTKIVELFNRIESTVANNDDSDDDW